MPPISKSLEGRTYAVTGAASGDRRGDDALSAEAGGRVITCDLRDADVVSDLTTCEGRAALVEGVTRLSEGRIDAIVANAGGGRPQTSLALNFFGAVATLEGLRPLLAASPAPRAVAVSSIAALRPVDVGILEARLRLDEPTAHAAASEALAARDGLALYSNAKHALNAWSRRAAAALAWCVGPENSMMTGQVLFRDGGAECLMRGESR